MSDELFPADAQPIDLYGWQGEAVDALRANIRRGTMNQILAAPTGAGKTVLASYLIHECHTKGKRAIFVADRIPLIDQTSATFDHYGIPHGVIQAKHWRWRPWERIQVASAQTLARRSSWPDADLIVVDEAHSIYASVVKRITQRDTITIGLTATPFTRGLGKLYDAAVTVRTTDQLIADGYLAPFRIFAASEPDMTGAKVTKLGEWDDNEAASRSMPIVGDIVAEYMKHGAGKKFIAFGVNVAHCEEIQRQMAAAGVVCGLYTYQTSDAEREQLIRDFKEPNGYLQGLVSVSALAKGFDNPAVEVVIMARPLRRSLAEFVQMFGRGLRRDPNNPDKTCILLDHSGNVVRFWDQFTDFFANGAGALDMGEKKEKKKAETKEREPVKCPKCAHVHDPRPMCTFCGYEYPRRAAQVEHVAGTLNELTGLPTGSKDDRQAVYSGLLEIARRRGYSDGWAAHQYKEKYQAWPNGLAKVEAPPSVQLERWVRSRLIRYAKGKAA